MEGETYINYTVHSNKESLKINLINLLTVKAADLITLDIAIHCLSHVL